MIGRPRFASPIAGSVVSPKLPPRARRIGLLAALVASTALLSQVAPAAAAGPVWRLESVSNPSATRGATQQYHVQLTNDGDTAIPATSGGDGENCVEGAPPPADPSRCFTLTATFPAGIKPLEAINQTYEGGFTCSVLAQLVTCSNPGQQQLAPRVPDGYRSITITTEIEPGAPLGTLTTAFSLAGPEAAAVTTKDATLITAGPPSFGVGDFDSQFSADAAGTVSTQAGAHPYLSSTAFEIPSIDESHPAYGSPWPVEALKDVVVDLPPGMLGNPETAEQCEAGQLVHPVEGSEQFSMDCPTSSQVGVVYAHILLQDRYIRGPEPLYNMVPPPGVLARFGFVVLGTVVTLDARVRSGGDYGISIGSIDTSEGLALTGVKTDFWGVPAAEVHDRDRPCPGNVDVPWRGGPVCPSDAPAEEAFLRNPTACTPAGSGLPMSISMTSWQHPETTVSRTIETHLPPGYPAAASEWGEAHGPDGCDEVPFQPSISVQPTTDAANSPSGLEVDLSMPQAGITEPEAISESDLRDAVVTLPAGLTVNPSSADGLGACSSAQVGLTTPPGQAPIQFSPAPAHCPDAAKIGSAEIETPLLDHPLPGAVYLAKQVDNPFESLLAIYIAVDDPQTGVVVKLAGRVSADPQTGQLQTVFNQNPQQPFRHLRVNLFSGPRASLRTPEACGTYTSQANLTPWSANPPVQVQSSFQITSGPGGGACPGAAFDPKLAAGTQNPLAGSYSPFSVRLTRSDSDQELFSLSVHTPPGLSARLAGVPWCPEPAIAAATALGGLGGAASELAAPSCPAASLLGTVTTAAGAGPNPFVLSTGRAYLAGPYQGARDSILTVVPVLAGPFDLGDTLVRIGLHVDPVTAQITAASDPLPRILDGIPLQIRDIRVNIDRPGFTINGTSCEPLAVGSTVRSTQGATATPASRFQLAGCDKLGFKPKLSLRLSGSHTRTGHPALRATLTMPEGGANLARAQVALPPTEILDNAHIGSPCTRVQYAAGGGGGEQCPPSSLLGHIRAVSPLLPEPLEGNLYLRSSDHLLPDLVASLDGRVHIDAAARIDSTKAGGLRTTFESVPDVPVSSVTLTMAGGKKGLLQNNTNICQRPHRATARFIAHNALLKDIQPAVVIACAGKKHRHARHR